MKQKYDYKFVRIGEGWLSVSKQNAESQYQRIIQDHARDGWRLVQIFTPSIGSYGMAKYYEMIFERELDA